MYRSTREKIYIIVSTIGLIAIGIYLILYALSDNIVFFYTPSEVHKINPHKEVRIGGLVENGTIKYLDKGLILFNIRDELSNMTIEYSGALPALFRENQGVVARGTWNVNSNIFKATELLIKHDEKYKPPSK